MADRLTKMEAEAFELLQKRFEELMQLRKALVMKILGSAYTYQCPHDLSLYTKAEAMKLGNICKVSDHWLQERDPVYQLAGRPISRSEIERLMEVDLEKVSYQEDDDSDDSDEEDKVSYDQHGRKVSYDEHGRKVSYDEHGHKVSYDEQGRKVSYDDDDSEGDKDDEDKVSYDRHGNKVSYSKKPRTSVDAIRERDSMTSNYRANAKGRDQTHGPTDDEMTDHERKRHGIAPKAKGAITWPVVSPKPEARGSSLTRRKAAGRLDGERLDAGKPPKRTTLL